MKKRMKMKTNILLILGALFFVGCSTQPTPKAENDSDKKEHIYEKKENKKQVPYIYNGNYKVKYAQKRIIWFSPYVTKEGDVVSERSITILPAYPSWTNEEEQYKVSDEILEFLENEKG
jgi:hypothetical protein